MSAASTCDDKGLFIEAPPTKNLPQNFKQGYVRSKWAAECLITQAQERGIQASNYRLGLVQGRQNDGIVNEGNHLALLLKSCIQFGVAPDLSMDFELTPVDVVSKAVVKLSLDNEPKKVYHLSHPEKISWRMFIESLLKEGYKIALIKTDQWINKYLTNVSQDNSLFTVASLYFDILDTTQNLCSARTQADLKRLGVHYPQINSTLLRQYVSYLRAVEFFNKINKELKSHACINS